MATDTELTSAITALSPVAYWKLSETSGTTLAQSGSSTAGALTLAGTYLLSAEALIPGDTTKFLTLHGGYASTSNRGNITPYLLNQNTFSCLIELVRPIATSVDYGELTLDPQLFSYSGTGETESVNVALAYFFSITDSSFAYVHEYGTGVNVQNAFNCTLGTYPVIGTEFKCHLIITRSSSEYTVWVNGEKRAVSRFSTAPTGATSSNIYLGTASDLRASPFMSLGHMCIFDKVLTDSEIWDLTVVSGYATGDKPSSMLTPNRGNELPISFVAPVANKQLSISTDPLIDLFVLRPELAYTVT